MPGLFTAPVTKTLISRMLVSVMYDSAPTMVLPTVSLINLADP